MKNPGPAPDRRAAASPTGRRASGAGRPHPRLPRIPVAVRLSDPAIACWNLDARQRRRLVRELPRGRFTFCDDAAALQAALAAARVAVTWRFRQEWLEAAPRLEWLATPAAGREYCAVARPGLTVTYGSFHGRIIGETVAAMVLAVNRGLLDAARLQAAGEAWPREALAPGMRLLAGTRAVIVGFGHIGTWIGRNLKPFGVRVTGVRRHPRAAPRPAWFGPGDRVVGMGALDRELGAADHVILALPGDATTGNLLDARRIARLKRGAALYNVGRGTVLDEAALVRALTSGRLRAACLDVFREEPLPPASPLLRVPGLHALPHASAIAPEYLDLFLDAFIAAFRARYPEG